MFKNSCSTDFFFSIVLFTGVFQYWCVCDKTRQCLITHTDRDSVLSHTQTHRLVTCMWQHIVTSIYILSSYCHHIVTSIYILSSYCHHIVTSMWYRITLSHLCDDLCVWQYLHESVCVIIDVCVTSVCVTRYYRVLSPTQDPWSI